MARKPLALLSILLLPAAAIAQREHPEPPARPAPQPIAPTDPSGKPPDPKEDSIPGLEDADFRLTDAPLRREGAFVLRQRGTMVRLPGGERAFIFHKDAQGLAERPMVLLACQTLQSMEQIAGDHADETIFLVTGQIYAYYNVNYLLPTAAPVAAVSEKVTNPSSKASPSSPQSPPDSARLKDPDVQSLIRGLEAQHERPRTLDSAPKPIDGPKSADRYADKQPVKGLLAENSTISRRRGRLVRLSTGQWAFAVDNGPSAESQTDMSLVLNPCSTLQRMEAWAAQLGDNATMQVSGRIYQYQGRNFIVPTMFQVTPPNELTPRQ